MEQYGIRFMGLFRKIFLSVDHLHAFIVGDSVGDVNRDANPTLLRNILNNRPYSFKKLVDNNICTVYNINVNEIHFHLRKHRIMTGEIPWDSRRGRNPGSSLHHMLEGRKYYGTGAYEHR